MPIHPTAIIDAQAEIDPSAEIGAYVVVEGPVRIGAGTRVYPHAYITGWTEIGRNCQIHPHAVIGHEPQDFAYSGAETYCRIGDEVVMREGVSIHRGTDPGSATVVGDRCFLMANAHVGHNCQVGKDVKMVNSSKLAGHVHVGDSAFIGGGASVHQFARIGELVMLGGLSGISMDVPPYFTAVHFGECIGVNVIGIRRAGFSREERDELRNAYRHLYRSGMVFSKAVEELAAMVVTEPGKKLAAFLRAPSPRGIAPAPRHDRSGRFKSSAV